MGGLKVLVSSWGNPLGWKNGNYYINDKFLGQWKTTYIPLFNLEMPNKGIIIVQNSLYPVFNVWEENSLKEKIKDKLKEFGANKEIIRKTEITVTISAGMYNGYKYEANFYDILLNLFIQLYFQLQNAREVILDVTHGINYLPTAVLLSILYLRKILGFKLKIYNFTPVISENQDAYLLDFGELELEGKIKINIDKLNKTHRDLKNIFREKLKFNAVYAFKLLAAYLYGLVFPLIKKSNFDFDDDILMSLIPKQEKDSNRYKTKKVVSSSEDLFKYIFTILFAKNIGKKFRYSKVDLKVLREIKEKIPNPVARKLIENEYNVLKSIYDSLEIPKNGIRYKDARDILKEKIKDIRIYETIRNYFAHVSFLWDNVYLYRDKIESSARDSPLKSIKELEL